MVWGKKEDKKLLPDLPPYRQPAIPVQQPMRDGSLHLEDDEETFDEKHELPSFPDSLNDKGFSQAAIKDAVSSNFEESSVIAPPEKYPNYQDNEPERIMPENNSKFQAIEMEEWTPSMRAGDSLPITRKPSNIPYSPITSSPRLEEPPVMNYERDEPPKKGGKNSDIFVKLDKFYSARKALFDAQDKLQEIDALLRKIRETKFREDQELKSWENELTGIKVKINDVAINLFEKVE
ncbi:MAG: hypothetical protein Q7S27_05090 [Nanoarchaeota archaeon]|nr:hypothetical protein [Nanoarchaeota archaeon]